MCGRFVRSTDIREFARLLAIADIESDLKPSFNIAPRQPVAVIMEEGRKKLVTMHWGLIPSWAHDASIADKLINARSETIAEKPSFAGPFKKQRCLILADGFYEWQKHGAKKTPVFIYMRNKQPFCLAGLYDRWIDPSGTEKVTCTIITTQANEFMKPIHHRMPVIIDPADYDRWLDPAFHDVEELMRITRSGAADSLHLHEVSPAVNHAGYNSPECILPAIEQRIVGERPVEQMQLWQE